MKLYFESVVNSLDEFELFAEKMSQEITPPSIVGLCGDLGVGKTGFAKFFVKHLGGDEDEVVSPTFTLLNEYEVNCGKIYHFDLYRLNSIEELEEIGYKEFFYSDSIVLVEWINIIPELFHKADLIIEIRMIDTSARKITVWKK